MQAGRCDFAAGVEVFYAGAADMVGLDSAYHVVGAWPDGYQIRTEVNAEALAQFGYQGESPGDMGLVHMANVQEDVGRAGLEHLSEDRPADYISWSKLGRFVILLHELASVGIPQHRAFSPQRFGDKRPAGACDVEGCRVELHELQVSQDRAGPVSHCQSVAGGHFRIGRFAIKPSRAAGGQDCIGGPDYLRSQTLNAADDSGAFVVLVRQQVDCVKMLDGGDIRMSCDLSDQGFGYYAAGAVAVSVGDPGVAVTAFEGYRDSVLFEVEFRSPVEQLPDQFRSLPDH